MNLRQLLTTRVLPLVVGILLGIVCVVYLWKGTPPEQAWPPAALPIHMEATTTGRLHMVSLPKPQLPPDHGRLDAFPHE